jgi:hypothetical protein
MPLVTTKWCILGTRLAWFIASPSIATDAAIERHAARDYGTKKGRKANTSALALWSSGVWSSSKESGIGSGANMRMGVGRRVKPLCQEMVLTKLCDHIYPPF